MITKPITIAGQRAAICVQDKTIDGSAIADNWRTLHGTACYMHAGGEWCTKSLTTWSAELRAVNLERVSTRMIRACSPSKHSTCSVCFETSQRSWHIDLHVDIIGSLCENKVLRQFNHFDDRILHERLQCYWRQFDLDRSYRERTLDWLARELESLPLVP